MNILENLTNNIVSSLKNEISYYILNKKKKRNLVRGVIFFQIVKKANKLHVLRGV